MKQPNTQQNRKELRDLMKDDLDSIFDEYIKLERTLITKSDIQKATDEFVKKYDESRMKWLKLIRSHTMEIAN